MHPVNNIDKFDMLSGESRLTDGLFSRYNFRFWSTQNPNVLISARHQGRFGFSVWCWILGSRFISNEAQKRFICIYSETTLETWYMTIWNIWFHHDGALAYKSRMVTICLTEHFGNRWSGLVARLLGHQDLI